MRKDSKKFLVIIMMLAICLLTLAACGKPESNKEIRSISSFEIDLNGDLLVTYSDGEISNIGKITGENGANGIDGVSISKAEINSDGELVISYSNGKFVKLGKVVGKDGTDGTNGTNGVDGISITDTEINSKGELIITYSDGKIINLGKVVGKDGADGTNGSDGANGSNGISITNTTININGELVITYSNGKIVNLGKVVGKDGTNGSNGSNGKSISNTEINSKGELIITYSDGEITNLGKVVGKDGLNGTNGTNGTNGKSIEKTRINIYGELIITYTDGEIVNVGNVQGPSGSDGLDGTNGTDGISIINTEINPNGELLITYSNGEITNVGRVVGINGTNGTNGTNGVDGISITNLQINIRGELIISFSDGKTTNLGRVVGRNGINGTNGVDGISISKTEINTNGELTITYSDGKVVNVGKVVGTNGTNGLSAYEIYKKNYGYYGTEKQWIEDALSGKLFRDMHNIELVTPVNTIVCARQQLVLPSKVNVIYKDGVQKSKDVIWDLNYFNNKIVGVQVVRGSIDGISYIAKCNVRVVKYYTSDMYIDGYVNNIISNDYPIVTISSDNYVDSVKVTGDGYFKFNNLKPGTYTVKVDAPGYYLVGSQEVQLSEINSNESSIYTNVNHVNFNLECVTDPGYFFEWEKLDIDNSVETSANINKVPDMTFEPSGDVSDLGYASNLRDIYNVVLVDGEKIWSNEHINRFYELYTTLPKEVTTNIKSEWKLVNRHINNDIEFNEVNGVYYVNLSIDAMKNSTPRVATIDGVKGSYFSKRLYHAMVRFVTNNGTDANRCETILKTNFLTSFKVPNYTELTAGITNEGPESFQEFNPEEKLLILTMFEEMPVGMHKMKELKYLVRRVTGHDNPIHPSAAAVTWTTAKTPYIEFMDKTFNDDIGYYDTKRLIIHEKTHMLWEHYFSQELKNKWCEIGGWYLNQDDPDGWSTSKTTEFVSAYGHKHNPDEDMAESVATYVINPDLLKSRSIAKYNFIKDYIMQGNYYLLGIREDLTFEVFNLNPDYVYPGMIEYIKVEVDGRPFEDKALWFTFRLKAGENAGASSINFRLMPKEDMSYGQFVDVKCGAINNEGTLFKGGVGLTKYSKSCYWYTDQITIKDSAGNSRYESNTDFTMKVFIDNPKEDSTPPVYIKEKMHLEVENANDPDHLDAQKLKVTGMVKENNGIKNVMLRLAQPNDLNATEDYFAKYINQETGEFKAEIFIPETWPTGKYTITHISLSDYAGNDVWLNLYENQGDNCTINIVTTNPDTEAPTLDENNIGLTAVPTKPQAPDGETLVTLTLKIKDNNSGIRIGNVKFIDPQGLTHFYWIYPKTGYNEAKEYFTHPTKSPTKEETYTFTMTLPKGSAPGIWGVYEITLTDFAMNTRVYNFSETMHFEITK